PIIIAIGNDANHAYFLQTTKIDMRPNAKVTISIGSCPVNKGVNLPRRTSIPVTTE
ncbi:unnamed protein product, partial [marine sediment metagenome]